MGFHQCYNYIGSDGRFFLHMPFQSDHINCVLYYNLRTCNIFFNWFCSWLGSLEMFTSRAISRPNFKWMRILEYCLMVNVHSNNFWCLFTIRWNCISTSDAVAKNDFWWFMAVRQIHTHMCVLDIHDTRHSKPLCNWILLCSFCSFALCSIIKIIYEQENWYNRCALCLSSGSQYFRGAFEALIHSCLPAITVTFQRIRNTNNTKLSAGKCQVTFRVLHVNA